MAEKRTTSISFTPEDRRRIKWLRKHFGGVGQGAVVTMALKALYEQQRATVPTVYNGAVPVTGSSGITLSNIKSSS